MYDCSNVGLSQEWGTDWGKSSLKGEGWAVRRGIWEVGGAAGNTHDRTVERVIWIDVPHCINEAYICSFVDFVLRL